MIPNALQPAQIEEVFLYPRLGRAIVLVKEDQLSLAIGRRGQNVRLASKLVGWDIEIMTHDELNEGIERAEGWFRQLPAVEDAQVEAFLGIPLGDGMGDPRLMKVPATEIAERDDVDRAAGGDHAACIGLSDENSGENREKR